MEPDMSQRIADCKRLDFNLAVFETCLFIISTFGNSLATYIFSRRKLNPATLLFLMLTVLNELLMLCLFFFTVMPDFCKTLPGCRTYADYNAYLHAYAFPVAVIVYCTITWVVVLMAVNRYIAISRPLQHHTVVTTRHICVEFVVVVIFCAAYNIPRFFEVDVTASHNATTVLAYFPEETELLENRHYQLYYKIMSFLLIMIVLPLVLLSVFTHKLIKEIKKHNLLRRSLQGLRRGLSTAVEEQKVTITLVTVILAFIVTTVPIGVNRILQLVSLYNYESIECIASNNTMFYLIKILNLSPEINAAFSWLIYGITSPQFRRDFKSLRGQNRRNERDVRRGANNVFTRF